MGGFGESYYTIIFFILAFLQEEVKDAMSSILCCIMSLMSTTFVEIAQGYGIGFFETVLFYDLTFTFLGLLLINCRAGVILFSVSLISFFFNIICWDFYTGFRDLVKSYYGIVNIILFELLLYGHFTTTRLYPWVKGKIKKLNLFLESKVKYYFNELRR